MQNKNNNWIAENMRLVIIVLFTVLALGFVLLGSLRSNKLIITSDDGAVIELAEHQNGDFEMLGTSSATFKNSIDGQIVYLRATKDNQVTMASAIMGEDEEINIATRKQISKKPKLLFEGAVSHPYFEEGEGFGIAPSTTSIVNFGIADFRPLRSELIGLGFAKNVFWTSADRFLYTTLGVGVGIYDRGKNPLTDTSPAFLAADRFGSEPFALLNFEGLYTLNSLQASPKKINDTILNNKILDIFTTKNSIYLASQPTPSEYIDDEEDGQKPELAEALGISITQLEQFSYSGEKTEDSKVVGARVEGIVDSNAGLVVATNLGIRYGDAFTRSYYGGASSVIEVNGTPFLLNQAGLWRLDTSNGHFQLAYSLKEGEAGLEDSLLISNGKLLFGTKQDNESLTRSSGGMYSLPLTTLE